MEFFKKQSIHERKIGDRSIILTADGNVEINPNGGNVRIDGDVSVTGNISGPKTSDVLYVNQDGSDDNDGRSQGPDGAKRTIKSAVEASVEGTTILVGPGDYFEENPIILPDRVTISGTGELRNTQIFPKNNTQTIFYVGNGCYLYQLTFRGLRDPGWCVEIRPGTLCTQSPYVQNCSNINGPWLNDGTEFIPFETVQLENVEPGARPLLVEDYPELPFEKQVNDIGGGNGMLVDGDQYNPASLVKSMVADAFTQIAQGGIGFHITNFGYTQIVSCFTVFCRTGFLTTKGGYLSISNSVSDFGINGCIADGFYPIAYTNGLPIQDYFSSVASVSIQNAGTGYASAPTVAIEPPLSPSGTQATAVAEIDPTTGELSAVTILDSGSGYTGVPQVTFVGGDATVPAQGIVNLSTNSTIQIQSLRDKPATGSIITFDGDPEYYYITGSEIIDSPFFYDEEICRRDVRRIIDAVTGDIVLKTNYQSIAAATSYLRGTASRVILDQLEPTVYALEVARDTMKSTITNQAMREEIDEKFNIILNALQAGDSAGIPDIVYSDLNSLDDGLIKAKNNILDNRDFIISELTSYINEQFTELSYNFKRYNEDVQLLIENLALYVIFGSDLQVLRSAQELKFRTRFKTMYVDSFNFLKDKFLNLPDIQSSATATQRVEEGFNQFINIIDDGDSSLITVEFPTHSGVVQNRLDAKNQLQANKEFLKSEFVAYIENEPIIFNFDGAVYAEDFGKIVDALTFDILYGGDSATVQEAKYYFANRNFATLGDTQRQLVVDAFARMRFVIDRIVKGIEVTPTTGNDVTQDFSSNNGTQSETSTLDALLFNIEDTIDNLTLDRLPTSRTFPVIENEPAELQTAYNQVRAQIISFTNDAIEFNAQNYPDNTYNVEKCKRDVGYIIDAIYRDAQTGSNHNTITAGLAYNRANTTYFDREQKPATIIALRHAKTLVENALIDSPTFQSTASNLFEDVLNIIEFDQSPSEGTEFPDPGPAGAELLAARDQLVANRDFLVEEAIAYLADNYFIYDSELYRNNTSFAIDAAYYDSAFGTNYNALNAGKEVLRSYSIDETTEAVGALNYTKGLANTALSSNSTAQTRSDATFDEIINILQNGEAAINAVLFTDPTDATTAQVNAKTNLQNNKQFIADEAAAYINNNYVNFTYNQTLFDDDLSLVLDAVALDSALGTNYNAVTAGLYYQKEYNSTRLANQKLQTIGALEYLRDQTVLLGLSDIVEPRTISAFDEIIDIVQNGVTGTDTSADSLQFPAPSVLPTTNAVEAKDQLIANKQFLIDDIIAYINDNYSGLVYNQSEYERDIGYIIDALCHDILYGGNSAILAATESYFNSSVNQFDPAQQTATADAFAHLATIVSSVVVNDPVTPQPNNNTLQDTLGNPATVTEANALDLLLQIVEDMITAGNITGLPSVTLPNILWTTLDVQEGYSVIKASKAALTTDVNQYISDTYQSFTFNADTCKRDTRYIVDALTYDILYGGNSAIYDAAKAYWNRSVSQVSGQEERTAEAFEYVSTIIDEIILNQVISNPEQTDSTQTLGSAGSSAEVTVAQNSLQLLQDVIINGIDVLPGKVFPDINWVDAGIQSAVNNLESQKDTIINDTISFINATYNGFSYDQDLCRRDTGYVLDAVTHDLLYGTQISGAKTNIATLIATRALILGSSQQKLIEQGAITSEVYSRIIIAAKACIEGSVFVPSTSNPETQVLLGEYGGISETSRTEELLNIYKTAAEQGNLVGTPGEVEPDFSWLSINTRSAALTLLNQKGQIQQSVIDYITETIIEFEYNTEKCERDTGYIVDAALYDMLYQGNKQTRRAALAYYNNAVIQGQELITAYSYYYLADILEKIANNIEIEKSNGNNLNQDLSIPDGSELGGDQLALLVNRIALAVLEGNTTGWQEIEHNYQLGSSEYFQERVIILNNEESIVETTIDDLNLEFGGKAEITVFPGIISVESDKEASLYNVSTISTSGHAFEYVGAGITYNALPFFGGTAIPEQEIIEIGQGKVFAGGTVDQIGNFRVGNFFGVNALNGSITLNANQLDLSGLTSIGPLIRDNVPVGVELKEISNNPALQASTGIQDPNTAPTQQAVSQYVENRYLNKTTGGTVTGDLILEGNFDVNGDVISTNVNEFNLLNTNAEIINAFGDATTINIGSATGLVTINPDLLVEGNFTVNGDIVFNGDVSLNIPDETLQAYSISTEGSLDYLSINTRTDEEKITFGDRPLVEIQNVTDSTNTTTGALVVDGGAGIAKTLNVGGNLNIDLNSVLGTDRALHTVDINAVTDIDVPDDRTEVFKIHENITDYFIINTTNSNEAIIIGDVPALELLNQVDATSSTTGSLKSAGGISSQRNIYAGVDIIADRNVIVGNNLEINGDRIITDEIGTFNLINTNATTINAFGAATDINIGSGTGTLTINNQQVIFDSVQTIQIPVGTTLERPTAITGQIRFNTDTQVFEGYDGIAWGSLGGVKDVDQDTFIRPETSPNSDNDELEFFIAGSRKMLLNSSILEISDTNTVNILNTTQSNNFASGALTVAGGVGIEKNLSVNGYITGDNNGLLQLTNLATDVIDIRANTVLAQDGIKLLTNAPDSAADDIVYPIILAHHTISGSPVAGSGTGIKFELETANNNFETGGQIDVIAQDVTGTQEDFDMVFSTMINGSLIEKLRIAENTSTFSTDITIDNNQLLTTQTTFELINDTATTVNFAGAATALNIGAAGGLTTINQSVQVNEDFTIDGTLVLTNVDLEVQYGGTGVSTFTENGILYGDTQNPVQVTDAAGTSDTQVSYQVLTVTSESDSTPVWTDTIDGGSF